MAAPTKTTSPIKVLASHLLDLDETMSKKMLKKFEVLVEKMFEDMSTAAGEHLHNLDVRKDSEDEVKAVVKKFHLRCHIAMRKDDCRFTQRYGTQNLLHLYHYWPR